MTELEEYRAQIDALDRRLVALFAQRMAVTAKVGEYKLREDIPVLDIERERSVLAAKAALVEDPILKGDVASLYQAIMGLSRRQQRRLISEGIEDPGYADYIEAQKSLRQSVPNPRVVYQGEPGAYSEEACVGFFGDGVNRVGLPWFNDVFTALQNGAADYAVLPIENSSTGSIRQVYDLLARYAYHIVGEWQVRVEHCLLARPGTTMADIKTVYSHEQGLMQCERFLDGHRDWRRIPTLDTAGSAKEVANGSDPTAAAICSKRAAQIYGLHVLAEGINHNAENFTRFVVISPRPEPCPGRDTVSAMLTLPHQSGSLHEILTIFAVHGLNLKKLESRPVPGRSWEYLFFLECSGDLTAPGMDGVLHEVSQLTVNMRILGNYKGYAP